MYERKMRNAKVIGVILVAFCFLFSCLIGG